MEQGIFMKYENKLIEGTYEIVNNKHFKNKINVIL